MEKNLQDRDFVEKILRDIVKISSVRECAKFTGNGVGKWEFFGVEKKSLPHDFLAQTKSVPCDFFPEKKSLTRDFGSKKQCPPAIFWSKK